MQYSALAANDQVNVGELDKRLRAYNIVASKLLEQAQVISDYAAITASALLTQLDAGAVIPNSSGLAGSVDLTKDELESMIGKINSLLALYNTAAERQLRIKAAGTANIS